MTVRIRLYFAVIYFRKVLYSFRNITVDNHGSFFRKCPEIAPVSVTVDLCDVCGPTPWWFFFGAKMTRAQCSKQRESKARLTARLRKKILNRRRGYRCIKFWFAFLTFPLQGITRGKVHFLNLYF